MTVSELRRLAAAGGIVDHVDDATGEHYRSIVMPCWEDVSALLACAEAARELIDRIREFGFDSQASAHAWDSLLNALAALDGEQT